LNKVVILFLFFCAQKSILIAW